MPAKRSPMLLKRLLFIRILKYLYFFFVDHIHTGLKAKHLTFYFIAEADVAFSL